MIIFQFAVLAAAMVVSIPLIVLAIECLAAHLPGRRNRTVGATSAMRVDVIVPAHDEADGIAATIASIVPQLGAHDRLWVVADNCQDATAEIARQARVCVLERHSANQRGKGFALDFGVRHLLSDPPDVLILIDADCILSPGAINALAARVMATGRPVQCAYLMRAPADAGPQGLVSEFAVTIKNLVRPLGLARLGLPCLLTGSGIALPWQVAREAKFCGNSIVEDMQLSVDLLYARHRTLFEPAARIVAPLPAKHEAAASQRRRWEHGHLQVLCDQVPRLLWGAIRHLRWDMIVVALDIAVPPLSLLGAIWLAILLLAVGIGSASGYWLPTILLVAGGSVAASAVAMAVWRFSPTRVPRRVLLSVPTYALRKLSLYASFPFARQTVWNRTCRDLPAGKRLDEAAPGSAGVLHAARGSESPLSSLVPALAEMEQRSGENISAAP